MLVKETKDLRKTSIALFPPLRPELVIVLDQKGQAIDKYSKYAIKKGLEDID